MLTTTYVCTNCRATMPRSEFGRSRVDNRHRSPLMCLTCKPPYRRKPGFDRTPGLSSYWCHRCKEVVKGTKFTLAHGRSRVRPYCRPCDLAQWRDRYWARSPKSRPDRMMGELAKRVREEFAFAREELGMTYAEAIAWLVESTGLTEKQLRNGLPE